MNKGFDDIEMLDIGASSSDDESVASSLIASSSETDAEPVVLKDWLNSDQMLDFHFNPKAYKESIQADGSVSAYTSYVNSLYKTVEGLSSLEFATPSSDDEDERIGLITSDSINAASDAKTKLDRQINNAFLKVTDDFSKLLHTVDDDGEVEKYEALASVLDCLLANVFYPDTNTRPVLLAQWINKFDHEPSEEMVTEIMLNTPKPYLHPLFWNNLLVKLISRGLLDKAVNVIANSKYHELQETCPQLHSVIEDLQSTLESYSSMALKSQFSQWKLTCCEFRDLFPRFRENVKDSEHAVILEQIHSLLCVVTGLPKTISTYCSKWYEIFTCLSLFQVRDDASLYGEYYDIAIKEKPPVQVHSSGDLVALTEKCFLDIIEGNYLHVLTMIDDIDSATASTVARLLEVKGLLQTYYVAQTAKSFEELMKGKTISEYLLTKFALQCLNNHPLVPVGIGLLLNSDVVTTQASIVNNRNIVKEFLPQYDCQTNDDLEWCLTICAKLGLVSTASELYRIHGKKSLKDGYLYEALNMLVNCFNYDSLDEGNQDGIKEVHHIIWDLIFQDSLVNNRPIKDELINNIVYHKVDKSFEVHPVIKQTISPYAVLVEFYNSLSDNKSLYAKEKLSKLIHLLEFIHLPKRFVPLLLAQVTPFLIESKYIFRIPDLIVVIELIDNFESQVSSEEYTSGEELYKYAIDNIEPAAAPYDWRLQMKQAGVSTPSDVAQLIRYLRNEIVRKIGQVYLANE